MMIILKIDQRPKEVIMGRYYEGDIKGKFWFSIQNSNDAEY